MHLNYAVLLNKTKKVRQMPDLFVMFELFSNNCLCRVDAYAGAHCCCNNAASDVLTL